MRKIIGVILLCGLFAGYGWSQTPSALEADARGWIDLLADRTLRDWTRVPVPPTAALGEVVQWKVDPSTGNLVCDGDKTGHEMLRYNREFANFVLHVEYRFTRLEGDAKYNSGVYARNNADGSIWHQAQVGSSSGGYLFGNTLVKGVQQRVNLRDQVRENRVKPAGEWNVFEIRAEGPKISLWVNGAVTGEFGQCEVPRGYVALEAEGYRIEFRNVKLKELP
jgi:hypothetical protein